MILMLNYARSGGTLLNRCLAADKNLVVLSEVGAYGSGQGPNMPSLRYGAISKQLLQWYDIKLEAEPIFEEEIAQIHLNKKIKDNLIIRDWTFSYFYPTFLNNYKPEKKLPIEKYSPDKVFALIRNPFDVWNSRNEPLSIFFKYYILYLKEIKEKNIKVFTFESLTKDQNIFFCELYFFLELTPNLSYKNFSEINNVCGDLQINTKINQRKNINENKNKNISSFKKKIYLNYIKNKNIEYLIGDEYLLDIKNRKTEKTKKIELFRYYFSGLKLPFKIFKNHLYWRLKK